ncbi:uncharacterized protein [Clytia hemisphaerica]|uniref:Uncharacterized protein n=1 Tax=Clytia hemisphaerica TaxID=252671 RepID=A0A7M5VGR6_9CNID
MSGSEKQPAPYTNEEYDKQIAELVQVNGIWKRDYEDLLHQNQKLKAALGMNPHSSRSTRSNSPNRHLQQTNTGQDPYSIRSTRSNSPHRHLQQTNTGQDPYSIRSTRSNSPHRHLHETNTGQDPYSIRSTRSNSPVRHSEASSLLQDLQLANTGPNPYVSPITTELSTPEDNSSYSSLNLSPRPHRKQNAHSTPSYPPSHSILTPPTTYARSHSDSQHPNTGVNIGQTEGYIQCAVADIEKMKEQIRSFKEQYEREREEKEKEKSKNKNLKRKLAENEEVTFQLHQRIDMLEKKIKKMERTDKVEQQRKADLMGRGAFPRNELGFTGYKDERDSMAPRYQQQQQQQLHQHNRREFEGGTTELKHQKFRQIYPLIY